jgi:hypothetical protein
MNRSDPRSVHELALERMRNYTPKDWHDAGVRAGIWTPDGQLTPEYGGPPRVRSLGGTFVIDDGHDHFGTLADAVSQDLADMFRHLYVHRFRSQGELARQLHEARAKSYRWSA